MNLEFFERLSDDEGPMLLFFGGGPDEVALLRQVFRSLAENVGRRILLHELPFIRAVNGCSLVGVSSNEERGVVRVGQPSSFEWIMKPSSWDNSECLLEPFSHAHKESGFQFLNPGPGHDVVYSTSRAT